MIAPNSREAYEGLDLNARQAEVLSAIEEIGPCTDMEIAAHLGWEINRVTGRRGELVEKGLVVKAGDRPHQCGSRVTKRSVWTLRPRQADLFASAA
jgi:DNA-binding MarR family transcriptional regulator